ncbi:guanylate kinase [Moraxella caviae]|uniref:Guanylate kinase n=1 Tax=Moraxella caviae TaxID=34060 RepID=A0A1T0A1E1_9GAMM|nr:guanylate kinase [Moraxella caviae]OOR89560.1 guanylate kinase [Moraxella caviae]STZ10239.1 Guanylate kinase [Moraxella caviae]
MSAQTQAKGTLFIITAASGTGKTSLVKELLATTDNLKVSISHTTRAPRPGETHGEHYFFVSKDEFLSLIDEGAFLEHANVFDNHYGTSKAAVQSLLDAGTDVILEIDWQGALQVKEKFDDVVMIFILPPSRAALASRLSNRGQDSKEVIEKRLAGAITEMTQHTHFDFVVINDDFATALKELQGIIITERLRTAKQRTRHAAMIADLLTP